MIQKLILLFVNLILLICSKGYGAEDLYVKDVSNPVISLNGNRKICLTPSVQFWSDKELDESWKRNSGAGIMYNTRIHYSTGYTFYL